MSELISLFEGAAFALLIKGDIYQFINTVFGKTAEEASNTLNNEIRNFNAKRTAEAFAEVYRRLEDKDIAANKVSLKLLYPTLEGLCIEEDEDLQACWINLLESEVAGDYIHPSFPKILAELSPSDAKVLETFCGTVPIQRQLVEEKRPLGNVRNIGITCESLAKSIGIASEILEVSVDTLVRLNLCERVFLNEASTTLVQESDRRRVGITSLGLSFLQAVHPKN